MDWMRIFCFMIRTKSEQRFQLWHYKRLHCFLPLLFLLRISFTFTSTSGGEMKANAKMVVWAYDEEMHCNYLDGKLSTITLTNLWILIEMDIQMTWWLLLSYHPSKIHTKCRKSFPISFQLCGSCGLFLISQVVRLFDHFFLRIFSRWTRFIGLDIIYRLFFVVFC